MEKFDWRKERKNIRTQHPSHRGGFISFLCQLLTVHQEREGRKSMKTVLTVMGVRREGSIFIYIGGGDRASKDVPPMMIEKMTET